MRARLLRNPLLVISGRAGLSLNSLPVADRHECPIHVITCSGVARNGHCRPKQVYGRPAEYRMLDARLPGETRPEDRRIFSFKRNPRLGHLPW